MNHVKQKRQKARKLQMCPHTSSVARVKKQSKKKKSGNKNLDIFQVNSTKQEKCTRNNNNHDNIVLGAP